MTEDAEMVERDRAAADANALQIRMDLSPIPHHRASRIEEALQNLVNYLDDPDAALDWWHGQGWAGTGTDLLDYLTQAGRAALDRAAGQQDGACFGHFFLSYARGVHA